MLIKNAYSIYNVSIILLNPCISSTFRTVAMLETCVHLQVIFHIDYMYVGILFVNYSNAKFHLRSSDGSLVITIKPEAGN
jgi:hypothetical protein